MSSLTRCDHCGKEMPSNVQIFGVHIEVYQRTGITTEGHVLNKNADACSIPCALSYVLQLAADKAREKAKSVL